MAAVAGTVNILFKSRKRAESARQRYINIDYTKRCPLNAPGSLKYSMRFYFSRTHTHIGKITRRFGEQRETERRIQQLEKDVVEQGLERERDKDRDRGVKQFESHESSWKLEGNIEEWGFYSEQTH